jgi:hypothetical protein
MTTPRRLDAYPCHYCGKILKVSGSTLPRHKAAPGYPGFAGWSGGTLTHGWCLGGGKNPCGNIHPDHKHPHDEATGQ